MFSSLYWERLEEGRKGREDYIDFRYNVKINNGICVIILEQMNVHIRDWKTSSCLFNHKTRGFILCCISFLLSKAFAAPESSAIC